MVIGGFSAVTFTFARIISGDWINHPSKPQIINIISNESAKIELNFLGNLLITSLNSSEW
ncbi:hypothetical protein CLA01_39830 [Chryseobacterium lathyri]|uniref:Uncharacterized protein n=1 Tax=Chryseobacterium lathyri TaxID=395933 RepID=A0A511YFE6_9FLAO|nr:hypothetical protein CLA01_39830 [Chryseobacterium lathyri]